VGNMKRRKFIVLIGGAAAAWPLAARAAEIGPHRCSCQLSLAATAEIRAKTERTWLCRGGTVRFEYRFAEGHDDRYSILAPELVALPVDLILTSGTPAALAAKTATSTIPIVMGSIGDAVNTGIVSSLARPGGNITGFSALNLELEGKRLELLKLLIPQLSRVGMLANAANPLLDVSLKSLRSAADVLGVSLDIFEIRRTDEIDGALLKLVQARPEAVVVAADTLLLNSRREIVEALTKGNLPAIYPFREYAAVGGLLVHGANLSVLFERAAAYVDRILKGAKPGDLPVQQATEFEIIINLKAASALGLKFPPTLLSRADEVIE